MANFYIKHNLYPDNPHLFTINISQVVKSEGEPNTDYFMDHRGEHYWEISITTTGTDANGDSLDTAWIDEFSSEHDVDEAVSNELSRICSLIDWSAQGDFEEQADVYAPFVSSQSPLPNAVDVPIDSTIRVVIKENLPGKGVDISTLSFKVNDIPVTPEVTGNPFEYTITYSPVPLV